MPRPLIRLTMNGHEELQAVARARRQADVFPSELSMSRIRFAAWAAHGALALAIGATVWVTTIQITITRHGKDIEENTRTRNDLNMIILPGLRSGIDSAKADAARNEASIKALQSKVYGF